MNIVFLTRFYKPHVGGVERHVEEVGKQLLKLGYDVKVITTRYDSNLKNKEKIKGIEVLRFQQPKIRFFGLIYTWIWLITKIRLFRDCDIVHIHDVFIWYLPLRLILTRKRVFITFHGYPDYPIPKQALFFQRIAQNLTEGNITIGRFIEKWYGTKSDIVSCGAVELKKFKPDKKNKYEYDALFSSRLDDQTGILTYLDAVKIIRKKGIYFKILVLGDGKYKKQADEIANTKGWVADPSKYYNRCQFAFVNRYLGVLEAFASKKLVFAVYDNPLKKDYLYMTPFEKWIIIENNPKNLAEEIIYYKNNKKKSDEMVRKAYRWVQSQTWEKMAKHYLNLWNVK